MHEIRLYRNILKEINHVRNMHSLHGTFWTLIVFLLIAGVPLVCGILFLDMGDLNDATDGFMGVIVIIYLMLTLMLSSEVGRFMQAKKIAEYNNRDEMIVKGMSNMFGMPYDDTRSYYMNLIKYKEYLESL